MPYKLADVPRTALARHPTTNSSCLVIITIITIIIIILMISAPVVVKMQCRKSLLQIYAGGSQGDDTKHVRIVEAVPSAVAGISDPGDNGKIRFDSYGNGKKYT